MTSGILYPIPSARLPRPTDTPVFHQLEEGAGVELTEYEQAVAREADRLRINEAARGIITTERALANWTRPPSTGTLVDELAIPDQEHPYAINQLLPSGGNAVLTAQFKAGKTTPLHRNTAGKGKRG